MGQGRRTSLEKGLIPSKVTASHPNILCYSFYCISCQQGGLFALSGNRHSVMLFEVHTNLLNYKAQGYFGSNITVELVKMAFS